MNDGIPPDVFQREAVRTLRHYPKVPQRVYHGVNSCHLLSLVLHHPSEVMEGAYPKTRVPLPYR